MPDKDIPSSPCHARLTAQLGSAVGSCSASGDSRRLRALVRCLGRASAFGNTDDSTPATSACQADPRPFQPIRTLLRSMSDQIAQAGDRRPGSPPTRGPAPGARSPARTRARPARGLWSGIGPCLTALLPPQNRAGHSRGTRLPGRPRPSGLLAGWDCSPLTPFAHPCGRHLTCISACPCSPRVWVVTPSQVSALSGQADRPIQPVMISRCLSAAGLRFLGRLLPAVDFCPPYGRPTG
jgi:hypothetical protein